MRRPLIAMAAVLLSGAIGGANEKRPVVQEVIHATPEKIRKAALAMLVRDGYTVAYDTASQLRISRQWSSEGEGETLRPLILQCRRCVGQTSADCKKKRPVYA